MRAGFRVDQLGQLNHGIVRIVDGREAPCGQALANGHVLERGALNQFGGAVARRFAGEHGFHRRVVAAQNLGHHSQRIGELHGFQVVVNRRIGKELKFQRIQARFRVFAQTFRVRLGRFLRQADQLDGDVK